MPEPDITWLTMSDLKSGGITAAILVAVYFLPRFNEIIRGRAADQRAKDQQAAADGRAGDQQRYDQQALIIQDLRKQAEHHEARIQKAEDGERECLKNVSELRESRAVTAGENAAFRIQIEHMQHEMRLLSMQVGVAGGTAFGVVAVTATLEGTIVNVAGDSSGMLNYLPTELVGQSIELLIPDRYLAPHREAVAKATSGGLPPVRDKLIIGFAKKRSGDEIPVRITLSEWQNAQGQRKVVAVMQHSRETPGVVVGGRRREDAAITPTNP